MSISFLSIRSVGEIHLTALLALQCGLLPLAAATAAEATKPELLSTFRAGPMRDVADIVFAARGVNPTDGHWYANFGYYSHDPNRKAYTEGAKLYRLNLSTHGLTPLARRSQGRGARPAS